MSDAPRWDLSNYFVDEAGDPALFKKHGTTIVGRPGCSTHFMIGHVEADQPAKLKAALEVVKARGVKLGYPQLGADKLTWPSPKWALPLPLQSRRHGGERPRPVSPGSQGSKSGSGDQMRLGIEGVVDSCVAGQEPLG